MFTVPEQTDEQKERMLRGELYHAFSPVLTAERSRCAQACHNFNTNAASVSRVERINLFHAIQNKPAVTSASSDHPWVEPPLHVDYGYNLHLAENVFINFNFTALDTCAIRIGARTLIGPSVSLYAGTHPLSASLRNGTSGPELGSEIHIGEDCWLGGGVVVLPGVKIGNRVVVGAGSVVTRDTGDDVVVVGNPAKVVRRLRGPEDDVGDKVEGEGVSALKKRLEDLEAEMAEVRRKLEMVLEIDGKKI